jgi:hypothetical protein
VAGLLTEESNKVALIAWRDACGEEARLFSGDRVVTVLFLQLLSGTSSKDICPRHL